MRKFLNFFIGLFIVVAAVFTLWENKSYLRGQPKLITKAEDTQIYYGNEKLHINGVNLDSVKPGYLPGNYAATSEDYQTWLKQIAALNMNCVKVKSIMPARFYSALNDYNRHHKKKLLLIQGINITSDDIDEESFKTDKKDINKAIKQRVKDTVDVIHGNKTPIVSKNIKELYTADVSPYTIAYSVDSSLEYEDIVYSEIVNTKNQRYENQFIKTTKDALSTEKLFAKIGNDVMSYEDRRYQTQRLLTIQGSRSDVVESLMMKEQHKKVSTERKRYIDIHNFKTTNKVKSGLVASYSLNLENNESLNYDGGLKGQIERLKEYNKHLPILISEYAVPNTKVGDNYSSDTDEGRINEEQQAKNLMEILDIIKEENLSGQVLLEWQDSWYRTAWNIKDLVKRKQAKYWNNPLSYSQHYGLLSFDTSRKYPDGNLNDWKDVKPIAKNGDLSLSVQQDESYLMLCLQSKQPLGQDKVRFSFDVTPDSGTKTAMGDTYTRPIDFIVDLGPKDGHIYVQDYYDTADFERNKDKIRQNPNYHLNKKGQHFSEEEIKVQNRYYSQLKGQFMPEKYASIGQLTKGNGNPKSANFDSNTDFYRDEHTIELRIPWQMLNFYDPSQSEIIGDLYQNRSIRPKKINEIYIGATVGDNHLKESAYTLKKWGMPTYQPRLKQSYYMLQKYFNAEGN